METNDDKPTPVLAISWMTVLFQIHLHMSAAYAIILILTQAKLSTTLFCGLLVFFGMLGITLGAHRLWAHRAFEADWPLKTVLAFFFTLNCQGTIMDWAVTHRVHHRYHGTPNDPFNYKKGFLHCHMGSHCIQTNPDFERSKRHSESSDLEEDSVVYFHHWLYFIFMPVIGIFLPVYIGQTFLGETPLVSIFVLGVLRITLLVHLNWLVHSSFLVWGMDPSDRKSGETWLVFFINKSLWPQYHYLLPWDYRSGEYGTYNSGFNTTILKVLAAVGLVTNLKTITSAGVRNALSKSVTDKKPLKDCLEAEKLVLSDLLLDEPEGIPASI